MKKIKGILLLLALSVSILGSQIENTKCAWDPDSYCYNQNESDGYIYIFEDGIKQGILTEYDVFEAIAYYNYLTPTGLDIFLTRGNIPSYIDDLIAVGRLPQGYTVSAGSTTSTVTTPSASVPVTQEPVNTTPTLDESKAGTYVVIDSDVKSYATYNKENEVRTWTLAEQVNVKGLMSNGYYKVVFEDKEQYIDKSHLATLEKYEAAWEETEKVESKCEVAGSVTYTNSLTKETKTEVLEALEHEYVQAEETLPTCTSKGEKKFICSLCGDEKIETTDALGHVEGETKVIKRENFLFSPENPLITDATETTCSICGEIIATSDAQINWLNIIRFIVVVVAGTGICVFLMSKQKKG